MLGQGEESLIIHVVAVAKLDSPEHFAASGELGNAFRRDLLATCEVNALCFGTVGCKSEESGVRNVGDVGEVDCDELRCILEHFYEGCIGDVGATGESEPLEASASGHHEEELVLELIGEQSEVEPSHKLGVREELLRLSDDSYQLEQGRDLEERGTVPQQFDAIQAPRLADQETGKQVGRIEHEVLENVEENLMWQVGCRAEGHVLQDPCAVGGCGRCRYESATTRKADSGGVEGAFDCATPVRSGIGVLDLGRVCKVFVTGTVVRLRSARR